MKAIPVNETAMVAHLKAIESERILNQISGDVMNTIYSLQTMMSAYGAKDMAEVDAEDFEDATYILQVRKSGEYCRNPYYK